MTQPFSRRLLWITHPIFGRTRRELTKGLILLKKQGLQTLLFFDCRHPIITKGVYPHLGEFTFRANHREMENAMFDFLIETV